MSITLALESAIAGGSISLLDRELEIDNWTGSTDISKAEDLLVNIDKLLINNRVSRHDVRRIAVSAGPGSFTGIRIGLATALGLKNGLGAAMTTVSALEAIAATTTCKDIIIAIPMGRNSICLQQFINVTVGQPNTLENERFVELVRNDNQNKYFVHEKLYSVELQLPNVLNFGANVAKAVGSYAIEHPDINVEPLFISKAAQ